MTMTARRAGRSTPGRCAGFLLCLALLSGSGPLVGAEMTVEDFVIAVEPEQSVHVGGIKPELALQAGDLGLSIKGRGSPLFGCVTRAGTDAVTTWLIRQAKFFGHEQPVLPEDWTDLPAGGLPGKRVLRRWRGKDGSDWYIDMGQVTKRASTFFWCRCGKLKSDQEWTDLVQDEGPRRLR